MYFSILSVAPFPSEPSWEDKLLIPISFAWSSQAWVNFGLYINGFTGFCFFKNSIASYTPLTPSNVSIGFSPGYLNILSLKKIVAFSNFSI